MSKSRTSGLTMVLIISPRMVKSFDPFPQGDGSKEWTHQIDPWFGASNFDPWNPLLAFYKPFFSSRCLASYVGISSFLVCNSSIYVLGSKHAICFLVIHPIMGIGILGSWVYQCYSRIHHHPLVWVYNPTLDSTLTWTGQLNDTAPGYSWPWRINDNMTTSLTMGDTPQ